MRPFLLGYSSGYVFREGSGMNKKLVYVAAALIFGLAVFLLLPSDKDKIERLFSELTTLASEPKSEGGLAKIKRIKSFENLFAENITFGSLDLPVTGEISKEELTRLFFTVVERSKSVQLTHDGLAFGAIENNKAEVITRFYGKAILLDGELYENSATVKISLTKVDGDWKFREFEAVQDPRKS